MKTRAIVLLLLAALTAIMPAASAAARPDSTQLSRSDRLFYDPAPDSRLIEVNPNVAVGISSLMLNFQSAIPGVSNFMLAPGVLMRAGVDVRFNLNRSLGLGTGLEFGINNVDYSMGLIDNSSGSVTSIFMNKHFYDMQMPVFVSMRFSIDRRILWDVCAGAYISYGIGGKMKASGYTSGENAIGQPIVTHAEHEIDYFDADRPLFCGVKRTDWGPRVGTGLVYKRQWTFHAILQLSASNLAVNQGVLDLKYRNFSLAFQFGYIF